MLKIPKRKWLTDDVIGRAIAYIIRRAVFAGETGYELSPEMLNWDEFYDRPSPGPDPADCLAAHRRLREHDHAS